MNIHSTITLHNGSQMPVFGLGTWKLTKHTPEIIAKALQMGYPMIDTSGDYGTQPGIGEGIRLSGLNREDFYLVTKVEETEDAYESTKKNLQELGIEYADLMLIHRPPNDGIGMDLWAGLLRAKSEGFTKEVGVSNYSTEQLEELMESGTEAPVVNQIEWSPFGYSEGMLELCRNSGIVIQAYSPLTRGERLKEETLQAVAEKHGKTPAQVLLRWNLELGVVPIVKANTMDHLEENLAIFDFALDDDDMETLRSLNEAYSSLGATPAYM